MLSRPKTHFKSLHQAGLEPATSALGERCAIHCATGARLHRPYFEFMFIYHCEHINRYHLDISSMALLMKAKVCDFKFKQC